MRPCSLLSLATAVPPHVIEQARGEGAGRAKRSAARRRCSTGCRACSTMPGSLSATSSLRTTGTAATTAGMTATPSIWKPPKACSSTRRRAAIDKAGLTPREIDGVVTVSTTGIATPEPRGARVGPRIGLRDDVRRVPVFGLGCAGGVNGLVDRVADGARGARQQLAVRHGRDLLDLDPARQRRSGGGRRHRFVRRRRRGGRRDQRRAQPRAHHRLGREAVARHAADHGLGRRGPRPRGRLRPRHPAVHRSRARRSRGRNVRASSASRARTSTGSAAIPAA